MTTYGMVKGLFKTDFVDSEDTGTDPDRVSLKGTIEFLLNAPRIIDKGDPLQPIVLGSTPLIGVLDTSGYLCTPGNDGVTPQYQGLYVPPTDDPNFLPADNLAYTVTYKLKDPLNHPVNIPSHLLAVPGGSTVDLGDFIAPAGAPVESIAQSQAAAASAAASAAQAVANSLSFIVLNSGDTVPPGTPSNTVILRKA